MPPELSNVWIQVPLVAAFVFFALAMVKIMRDSATADQKRLLEHEAALQEKLLKHEATLQEETHAFLEQQNSRFLELLQIEKERRKEAMDQGLAEVDTISQSISRLADAMTLQSEAFARHDQMAIERHSKIIDELRNNDK